MEAVLRFLVCISSAVFSGVSRGLSQTWLCLGELSEIWTNCKSTYSLFCMC